MRQIVLDTETTGLSPADGHRIIEIGCVEIVDREITGKRFHTYLNPDREIDAEALGVHGLSQAFLADKPRFPDIANDFVRFIAGAELIIHNAPFDTGFINHELNLWHGENRSLEALCSILDTLVLAKRKHPGQRNNLDALCKRYAIDNKHRDLHGALLDAGILADLYLVMTGGQTRLALETSVVTESSGISPIRKTLPGPDTPRLPLRVIRASEQEWATHRIKLNGINRASGGKCLWQTEMETHQDGVCNH